MDIKCKACDIQTWEKHLSTYPPSALMHLSHCFTSVLKPLSATSTPLFQPLHHQQNVCHQGGFLGDQTDGSH
jgi:hypothetical protein